MEYWDRISYLKGGIVFSRLITTVSPRYAEEIQTPEFGFGFDGILRERAGRSGRAFSTESITISGIRRSDPNLPVALQCVKRSAGKAAAKRRVLEAFGLPDRPRRRWRGRWWG